MRLGMSTASLFTKVPTEDTFEVLKAMDIPICEVFLSSFSEYSGPVADDIIAKRCIEVYSVHSLTNQFEPELFSKNIRAEHDAIDVLNRFLTTAKALGAKHYTFHGATMLKKISINHDYDRLAIIINKLIEKCADYGVQLDYENVHWAYYSNPNYFIELSKRCPALRSTLDIKQAMQSGIPYAEYLKAVAGRLDTVHMCDYDSNGGLFIPGKGEFDFVELFCRLMDSGFDGAALVEVYPQGYGNMSELQGAYEYILECNERAIAMCK